MKFRLVEEIENIEDAINSSDQDKQDFVEKSETEVSTEVVDK